MNHDEAKRLLDDWIDGTLPPERAAAVESHVAGCAECRAESKDLRRLCAEAARLPRSVEPQRDLWPGIAAAIEGDGDAPERPARLRTRGLSKGTFLRILAPAAALAAAALAFVLLVDEGPGGRSGILAGGSDPAEMAPADPAAIRIAGAVEKECRRSDREMRHYLSPAVLESDTILRMQIDLDAVGRAAEEARSAWLASPDDPLLRRRMTAAYRTKAKLQADLVRVAALVAAAPSEEEPPRLQGRNAVEADDNRSA